ncbi:hypothetical protein KIN20_035265 [Parelaphostrongylus tenuis]|uniref:Uncharacterized protein n=1 Tax=Parelaphostrongylus tenuis TaxID=148309 RepID=A0AAD5WJT2_PARTN|nr:hypothetical protein KIN20_035265 [Parelaphostrongylus tenuis]
MANKAKHLCDAALSFRYLQERNYYQFSTLSIADNMADDLSDSKQAFDLEDMPECGRPSVLNESDLQATLDAESSSSTRDLTKELGVSWRTVANKLHQFGFVHKKPR